MIRLRFGIGCEREHTLEEIGQEFDVTRERIRQIEAKACGSYALPSGRGVCAPYLRRDNDQLEHGYARPGRNLST